MSAMPINADAIAGCLIGTAVGDALGLPYEGLSAQRAERLLGPPDRYRFLFGRGMVSDDTEHSVMVAQALAVSRADVRTFARALAWRMRIWLLGLPAGVGFATLRACLKLWMGFPPSKSGVHSAGNGPAMRSAILGVAVDDLELMGQLVEASARLTHTDPAASHGALVVALGARLAATRERVDVHEFLAVAETLVGAGTMLDLLEAVARSIAAGEDTRRFAESMGLGRGVSGYVNHTVPACIHAWLSNQDSFEQALRTIIECGGDADSTAAIVGGIMGAKCGPDGIPPAWRDGLFEWPFNHVWLARLADGLASRLAGNHTDLSFGYPVLRRLPRNVFFLIVVLFHGLRRLLPPY